MPAEKVKSTKPLMEKRRRARINDSLMQLKTLVLDALNKNNPRHSKLEKADILEMTVRYLRTIQRQQISASVNNEPAKLGQYRSGYAECVNEVTRYLGATATTTNAAPELRTQLVGHLANLCTSSQQTSPTKTSPISPHHQRQQSQAGPYQYATPIRHHQQLAEPTYATAPRDTVRGNAMSPSVDSTATIPARYTTVSPVPEGARAEFALTTPVYTNGPQSPKNSSRVVVSPPLDVAGSHPSGDITLVLPQQALPNGQLPTHFIPVYAPGPVAPNANTNIQTVSPSMPSPRSASTFQSIASDVSHRSVSPSSSAGSYSPVNVTCSSPVAFTSPPVLTTSHVQYQTELSPVTREYFTYPQSEMVNTSAHAQSHCVSKKESMWRPW